MLQAASPNPDLECQLRRQRHASHRRRRRGWRSSWRFLNHRGKERRWWHDTIRRVMFAQTGQMATNYAENVLMPGTQGAILVASDAGSAGPKTKVRRTSTRVRPEHRRGRKELVDVSLAIKLKMQLPDDMLATAKTIGSACASVKTVRWNKQHAMSCVPTTRFCRIALSRTPDES